MLPDSVLAAIVTGIFAVIVAYITSFYTAKKAASKEAIKIENRLTRLEENVFTKTDRQCLYELKVKLDYFLEYKQEEAAKALKNPPKLDIILTKIEQKGLRQTLTEAENGEKEDLKEYLQKVSNRSGSIYKRAHARFLLKEIESEDKIKELNLDSKCEDIF